MIYKTRPSTYTIRQLDYVIEMSKLTFCKELLNFSTKDLLVGGVLYENIEMYDIPEPQKYRISGGYYNAYPADNVIWEKYGLDGYVYLKDNASTGKIEVVHVESKY